MSSAASGAQRHEGALENLPEELRHRRQWVNWRYEERNDKMTKVPYTPGTRHRASCTDLEEWGSFEDAIGALDTGRFDGVGFMLSSGDPYTFIDLDECRNAITGEIGEEAQEIIDALDGYAEVSPSGRGIHIFVRGKVPGSKGRKRGWLEVYSWERYATMTGVPL